MSPYRFSSDVTEMDRDFIVAYLSGESYWAQGRTRERHDQAMDASLNFGMFDTDTGTQVAYARLITDTVTFAWLCDLFVDPAVQGQGVGIALMQGIVEFIEPLRLKRVGLTTADAHGLYEKFGWERLGEPTGTWMARLAPPATDPPTT